MHVYLGSSQVRSTRIAFTFSQALAIELVFLFRKQYLMCLCRQKEAMNSSFLSFSDSLAPVHYKLPATEKERKNSQKDPQLFGSPPTQQPFRSTNKNKEISDDAKVMMMTIGDGGKQQRKVESKDRLVIILFPQSRHFLQSGCEGGAKGEIKNKHEAEEKDKKRMPTATQREQQENRQHPFCYFVDTLP
jgi:hypothetical protein